MATSLTALVTGGNQGLGLETATQLAERGYRVFIASRKAGHGEAAAQALRARGLQADAVTLDVLDGDSVQAAARAVAASTDVLDVLVNNAGIFLRSPGSPLEQPPEDILLTMQTNFLGSVRVTQAVLPLLRRSAAGRVVNVSSGLGSIAQMADPHYEYARFKSLSYPASKAALNAATATFAALLADTPIKVNAADPGRCATDLNAHQGERTAAQGAAIIVRLATLGEDGPTGGFFDDHGRVPW